MVPAEVWLFPLLLTAVITAALAVYGFRHRREVAVDWFVVLMVIDTIWVLLYAAALTTTTWRVFIEVALLALAAWFTIPWLGFTLSFTGYGAFVTRRLVAALSVVPAVATVMLAVNPADLAWTDVSVETVGGLVAAELATGPLADALYAYMFVVFLAGFGVIAYRFVLDQWFEFRQGMALMAGTLLPFVTGVMAIAGYSPLAPLDPTPFVVLVAGACFWYALFAREIESMVPATRRLGVSTAVDVIDDGIVIVTGSGRIVSTNDPARQLLGEETEPVRGRPIGAVLGVDLEHLPTTLSPGGGRIYHVSAAPIDRADEELGHVVLLRDVTETERRRQRLQVLQRLLRHNIRNEMTVVQGYASILGNADGSDPEMAERIESSAEDLLSIAEKIRRIESSLDETGPTREAAVGTVLEDLLDSIASEHDTVDIEVAVDPALTVETDWTILEDVVRELVENAIEHHDGEHSSVVVVGEREGARAVLRVRDDGPGIPEQERTAVTTGRETPLEHASGLGLWMVAWGVQRLGGRLSFGDNEPRGSVVTVSIPLEPPSAAVATDRGASRSTTSPADGATGHATSGAVD